MRLYSMLSCKSIKFWSLHVRIMIPAFRKSHSSLLTSKIRLYVLVHWAALADSAQQTQYSLWLELFLSPATSLDWLLMSHTDSTFDGNTFYSVWENGKCGKKRTRSRMSLACCLRKMSVVRIGLLRRGCSVLCIARVNVCPDSTYCKWFME